MYIAEGIKAFGNLHDVIRVRENGSTAVPVDYTKQQDAKRMHYNLMSCSAFCILVMSAAEKAGCLAVKDEMKTKLQQS